jgi:hypothetical protein
MCCAKYPKEGEENLIFINFGAKKFTKKKTKNIIIITFDL